MYQNSVVELYKAVEHGGLEQVQQIINSKQVDINVLNRHEANIVDVLFTKAIAKDKDAKLKILIEAKVLPTIDPNNNFLMRTVTNVQDIAIRREVLAAVAKNHPNFHKYYRESHIQAINGKMPTNDQALETDAYGLYPIHYSIVAGVASESWFKPKLYDITKAITEGFYQGINIAWWLLFNNRFDEFDLLTRNLTPVQCYELLKAAQQNPKSDDNGISVAWLLLSEVISSTSNDDKLYVFNRLTYNLTPEHHFEILNAAPLNSEQAFYGMSVAWWLILCEGFDVFNRLTQNLTSEQRFEILKSAADSGNTYYGISVAWKLLQHKRFDDFNRLIQGLTSDQRFEISNATSHNPDVDDDGISVAWWLIGNKRFDDFNRLTQGFTSKQFFEILKSAPLSDENDDYMKTVFFLILNNKSYNFLLKCTKALNMAQLKELLLHPLYKKSLNGNDVEQYSTVIKVMIETHADFAHKLFNQYTYEDLINWYNSIEFDAIESQLIIHLCFSKLHEILHVSFTNAPEVITENHKDDIKKHLGDLFTYYQQILPQSPNYKEVRERLGMLLAQSAQTIFRKTVIKHLEESGNEHYLHISRLAGNSALEGYAHALRVVGNTSTENAVLLGIIHAQVKEQASKLAEENIKIKEQANKLAEENEKLKEEIAVLKQPPESSRDKPNNSQRNEKRPSFFAAAESYPVKKSKYKQAEQPHGLKGERQLR